jgi:hypothetical protein
MMAWVTVLVILFVLALNLQDAEGFQKVPTTLNKRAKFSAFTGLQKKMVAVDSANDIPNKSSRPNRIQNLQEQLASTGRAGLLAYGILNAAYYMSVTAMTCYITAKKYPFVINRGATLFQRVKFVLSRLGSVAGTVWVGSQITKIFRLSGAVICAPFVDKLMMQCQKRFKLPSRNAAFWFIFALLWAAVIVFYSSLVVYGTSTLYMSALETIL